MQNYYDNSATSFEIPIPVRISFPFSHYVGRYIYQPYGDYHAESAREKGITIADMRKKERNNYGL